MKLISCENCGVILDADKAGFPTNIYDNHGCIDQDKAAWDGGDYVPKVVCPVCGDDILQD